MTPNPSLARLRARFAIATLFVGVAVLGASRASADVADAVQMDPSIAPQWITYSSASNPSLVTLNVTFTANTRDAYSKTAPLQLPCDVDWLAIGVAYKNVSAQPLYIEWGGQLWLEGSEKKKVANVFGQTSQYAAPGLQWQPGEVGTGGFIYIAHPPLYNYTSDQFPPNVPMRLQLESRGFSAPDYDPSRGGYSLTNLVGEGVIWNNNYRVWVQRTCP
jgi:hypothetical protein